MTFAKVFLLTGAAAIAAPAIASTISVGSGPARICYLATESQNRPSEDQMNQCDLAFKEGGLSNYELVATHVNRGVLHVRRGQIDKGIADFDRAMALDANEPEAYLNKGAALVTAGQPQAALPLFSMALDKNTRKPAIAYYGRGVAYEEMGNVRSAYLDYRRATKADPKWAPPREDLSRFSVRPK
jgi:tetratricopeptide (TPR) repeat protein